MSLTVPLDQMTTAEKLRVMEDLWADLTGSEREFESPAWHESVLREREERVRSGEETAIAWEMAKKELRRAVDLIQRLSLNLEGIRPAFIPQIQIQNVRELKGFRHVTGHAYDLVLKADRLAELVHIADEVAVALPHWCAEVGPDRQSATGLSNRQPDRRRPRD